MTLELRIPENVHVPINCPINGLDCEGCATWQDGRALGYVEAALAIQHWDADEHEHADGEGCAVCLAVRAIEKYYGVSFPVGLPSAGPEARFEVAMMVHLGGIKQLGGGSPKPQIRPKADLARRRKLVLRVNLAAVAQARPRPATQLEDDRVECSGCGLPFIPGSGPGQDVLCPLCWDNRQPRARPERRRALGAVPPAAFMRRGDFAADVGQRGPFERVTTWGRRVFR